MITPAPTLVPALVPKPGHTLPPPAAIAPELATPDPALVPPPAVPAPAGAAPTPAPSTQTPYPGGAVAQPPLTGGIPPTTAAISRAASTPAWLPAASGAGFGLLAAVLVLGLRRRRPPVIVATVNGGLVEILEMLEDEHATGAVTLQHRGKTWRIYLQDGRPYHAAGPRRSGERVIVDALSWPRGSVTFRFEEALRARAATVRRSLGALVHEARYS